MATSTKSDHADNARTVIVPPSSFAGHWSTFRVFALVRSLRSHCAPSHSTQPASTGTSSLYIVIAQQWLHGDVPYVAVWDQHPMGLPALFAAAQFVIGDGLLAARILALLAVAGTATLLYATLANIGERLGGALGAFLYLLYMSRPDGLAANTEVINNLCITAASALLFSEMLRPAHALRTGRLFAAALLFGIGLQIKYVVLPEAVSLCCLVLVARGAAAPAHHASPAWPDLPCSAAFCRPWQRRCTSGGREPCNPIWMPICSPTPRYLSVPLTWAPPCCGCGTPAAHCRTAPGAAVARGPAAQRTNAAVWCLLALAHRLVDRRAVDVALPLKFWKHYFNALLPPLALAAGLAAALLADGSATPATMVRLRRDRMPGNTGGPADGEALARQPQHRRPTRLAPSPNGSVRPARRPRHLRVQLRPAGLQLRRCGYRLPASSSASNSPIST